MNLEVIKDIKISGVICVPGDILTDVDPDALKIYVRKGFAKESKGTLSANGTAELISKCESLDELNIYENDHRQVVVKAYNKKEKELNT